MCTRGTNKYNAISSFKYFLRCGYDDVRILYVYRQEKKQTANKQF